MATAKLPDDLLAKLQEAEDAKAEADERDAALKASEDALRLSQTSRDAAAEASAQAHKASSKVANEALVAIKDHFEI